MEIPLLMLDFLYVVFGWSSGLYDPSFQNALVNNRRIMGTLTASVHRTVSLTPQRLRLAAEGAIPKVTEARVMAEQMTMIAEERERAVTSFLRRGILSFHSIGTGTQRMPTEVKTLRIAMVIRV